MKRTTLLLCGLALLGAAGCDDDETNPATPQGGSSAGGSGGAGGLGGGGAEPSRGDPDTFPTDCLDSCEEACERLAECGGDASSLYPLEQDECNSRCGLAANGPIWDDQSGNFKCCASQDACEDVQHCGGWLKHPATSNSCGKLCDCFFSSAVAALTEGRKAPEGYRFAPDLVMLDPGPQSVDLSDIDGVHLEQDGPLKVLKLDRSASPETMAELERIGRILPTFVDGAGRVSAASGKIVVVAPEPGALVQARSAAERLGLPPLRKLRLRLVRRGPAELYVIDEVDGWRALDAVGELSAIAGIRAELDMVRHYSHALIPDDPMFDEQWHLLNTGQNDTAPSVDGRVSEAWDLTTGDDAVIIAINDDGVDINHPEFSDKLEDELNFPDDWEDRMALGLFGGHGTACAGVAAAQGNNGLGVAGVCPDCSVLPHMVGLSTGLGFQVSDVEIAEGFERQIDAGAWVISNSWANTTGDPVYVMPTLPDPPLPSVIEAAFDYAETEGREGKGTVVLYSAGNSNDVLHAYARYDSTMSVAAVGDVGLKSYYSASGPEQDIAAPSNGGLHGITTTSIDEGYTSSFGGTSSACPFVAGVAGLVLAANPELSAAEVRQILQDSSTAIDPVFGDWDEGHSPHYGHGLVNAYIAVQMATGNCVDPAECPAPSDDCDPDCGTVTSCGECRVQADCAPDHVCQALPSLGQMVCVAAEDGSCPAGTHEAGGYCLPTPETCELCGDTEECNGRDDNCDGQVDEGDVCDSGPLCFIDGPGCGSGQACAAYRCAQECDDDEDCDEGETCEQVKDQYGAVSGVKACIMTNASYCQIGCEVLVSSTEDEVLEGFVECMEDGAAPCNSVFMCAAGLPIELP